MLSVVKYLNTTSLAQYTACVHVSSRFYLTFFYEIVISDRQHTSVSPDTFVHVFILLFIKYDYLLYIDLHLLKIEHNPSITFAGTTDKLKLTGQNLGPGFQLWLWLCMCLHCKTLLRTKHSSLKLAFVASH
jgi:hypothetical protein